MSGERVPADCLACGGTGDEYVDSMLAVGIPGGMYPVGPCQECADQPVAADSLTERLSAESERQYQHHLADYVFHADPDVFHDGTLALDDAQAEIERLRAALRKVVKFRCPVHSNAACPEEYMLDREGNVLPSYEGHFVYCGQRPKLADFLEGDEG